MPATQAMTQDDLLRRLGAALGQAHSNMAQMPVSTPIADLIAAQRASRERAALLRAVLPPRTTSYVPSVPRPSPSLTPQHIQSVANMRMAADQADIARQRMASEEERAAAAEELGTARLALEAQQEQRLAAEPTWQQRFQAETMGRAIAGDYTAARDNAAAIEFERAKRALPPTPEDQSLMDYRTALINSMGKDNALPSMASYSPLSRVQAAQIARSMGVPADQIAEITGVTIPTGVPGLLARMGQALQGSERYLRGYNAGRATAGTAKPQASTAVLNGLRTMIENSRTDEEAEPYKRRLKQILGAGAGAQDQQIPSIGVDENGNVVWK